MNDELSGLTDRLTEVMAAETALLDALDLAGAAALLGRKRDAVAALQGAMSAQGVAALDAEQTDALRASLDAMAEQAEANRLAIERGLALQMRLIETIAQAVPRARATEAPVYQNDGSQQPGRPPEAYAFLSQM